MFLLRQSIQCEGIGSRSTRTGGWCCRGSKKHWTKQALEILLIFVRYHLTLRMAFYPTNRKESPMKTIGIILSVIVLLGSVSTSLAQPPDTITVTIQLAPGWNMVSNPVITANDSIPVLFPMCVGCGVWLPPPWYYDDCRLPHGRGRWLKGPNGGTVSVTGVSITADTIPVATNWNIIGSLSYPVATSSVTSIPPNIIASRFFGYSTGIGYTRVDTLRPGSSYWVKVNQAGGIVLSTSF